VKKRSAFLGGRHAGPEGVADWSDDAWMAAGQAWHLIFPINKQLWTSSYVLLTAGAAAILLAACMYLIDIRVIRAWSHPFVVLGRNAIALFVVSGLIGKLLILIPVHEANGTRTVLQSLIFDYGFQWMGPPQIASRPKDFSSGSDKPSPANRWVSSCLGRCSRKNNPETPWRVPMHLDPP